MKNSNETGHANNVVNFEKLTGAIGNLGPTYNPARANLKLAAVSGLLNSAYIVLADTNNAEAAYNLAVKARDAAYDILSKTITRISNAASASDISEQQLEIIKALVRKLRGKRAKAYATDAEKEAAAANGEEINEISSSRMGYDNRLDNFDKLIKTLAIIPTYTPNESDLKIPALTNMYTSLKSKNTAVYSAELMLDTKKLKRTEILYKADTGLVDTALDIKKYVKSVYGATSNEFKEISGLSFIYKKR